MRTLHILLTLLAAGALLAGCQKQPVPAPEGPDGGQTLTLKAIVEGGTQTKVDIATATGAPSWTTGDQVKYCITNGATTQYNTSTVDISAGEISVTIPAGYYRANYAIYPASAAPASPAAADYTTPRVVYASTYDISGHTAETFSPCPMVADNTATDLVFYHVGGLLRLHVSDIPSGTRSLRVVFNGVSYVTGTFSVSSAGTASALCTKSGTDGGNAVTFTNGSNDFGGSTYLNVPIPAMNYSALTGILIYCLDSSGATILLMRKDMTWGNYARAAGRTASFDSSDGVTVFSVSATTTVRFSKGNLQAKISSGPTNTYNYAASEWRFADNQWEYLYNPLDADAVTNKEWVDHFGWVGTSASWDTYGLCTDQTTGGSTYYGTAGDEDALKTDWGSIEGVIAACGPGWRTLTNDEWGYLFNTREAGTTVGSTTHARYTEATIRTDVSSGVNGIILFPDGVSFAASEFTTVGTINAASAWTTKCTATQWTALEAKGCVFLPAAGYRYGAGVRNGGSSGYYWSASPYGVGSARRVYFSSGYVDPQNYRYRRYGFSVRLVR